VTDWIAAAGSAAASLAHEGVEIVSDGRAVPLHVDPVPRVVDGAEWDRLAAGLAQRVRAVEAFLRDPREAVRAGVVPAEVVGTCLYREPGPAPSPVPVGVAGPDVVRVGDGDLVVLEDNLRTPTLMGYAQAVARAVRGAVPTPPGLRPALGGLVEGLARVLRAAAPDVDEPVVAVLGDDRGTNVRWEPAHLARQLDVPLVDLTSLRARGDRLLLPDGRAVDVLWRRTSEERLRGDDGRPNRYGSALLPGLASGRLRVVNPYGTGVADDKRTYPYVEQLVRFHLGEEPLVRSVRSWDLGDRAQRADVWERLGELVLKPRSGSGGRGVTVMPRVDPTTRDAVRRVVADDPGGWVAQELVPLSTELTVVDGTLVPRHVDLRPCVLSDGSGVTVLDGGLTRVALRDGELVVNCSQGGGAKDTWVVDAFDG
jgi:carboxylate-amine ligase